MTTLKPLGDRVMITPAAPEEVTQSGIIIPDTASKEKPMRGTIAAISDSPTSEEGGKILASLSIGSMVYFTKYAPTEIEVGGAEVCILDTKSILAVEA